MRTTGGRTGFASSDSDVGCCSLPCTDYRRSSAQHSAGHATLVLPPQDYGSHATACEGRTKEKLFAPIRRSSSSASAPSRSRAWTCRAAPRVPRRSKNHSWHAAPHRSPQAGQAEAAEPKSAMRSGRVACCARPGHCVCAVPPVLSHHRCRSLGHRRPPVASGGRDESRNRTERGPFVIKCGRGYARVSMTRHGGRPDRRSLPV